MYMLQPFGFSLVETARRILKEEVSDGSSRLSDYLECVSASGEACFNLLDIRCTSISMALH